MFISSPSVPPLKSEQLQYKYWVWDQTYYMMPSEYVENKEERNVTNDCKNS